MTQDTTPASPDVDQYGNPTDGSSTPFCSYPDCGCDGVRLCMADSLANDNALALNLDRRPNVSSVTAPMVPSRK